MAGLPANSSSVCVGPPFEASDPSAPTAAETTSARPAGAEPVQVELVAALKPSSSQLPPACQQLPSSTFPARKISLWVVSNPLARFAPSAACDCGAADEELFAANVE